MGPSKLDTPLLLPACITLVFPFLDDEGVRPMTSLTEAAHLRSLSRCTLHPDGARTLTRLDVLCELEATTGEEELETATTAAT